MIKSEFDTLVPAHSAFNRRSFVRGALGSGFAAAVLPVVAQTAIKTDTAGLLTGEFNIDVAGFKMPIYRACPVAHAGRSGPPVVLVLSEVFGVHEYIADVANRFARAGYFAIAPELFARHGDAMAYGELAKLLAEVVSKATDAQVMADLDACLRWAKTQGADSERAAVTGFCWGGRQTWLYAAHNPKLRAAVAWYGRLVGDASTLTPHHPLDVALRLYAPVLGLYGGQDTAIPLDGVKAMKAALALGSMASRKSEFVIYPDAPHAFHADYRPTYRQAAAEDSWQRCLAWLEAHGVAP